MSEDGNTAFSAEIDNLNLAAWLVANGVPIQARKRVTITTTDSTTHDTQRGTWTFSGYDLTGRTLTADLIAGYHLPKSGEQMEPGQVYALACHNWLCLKSCVSQGAPLYYSFLTTDKQRIRLSNRQGEPVARANIAAGTSSLILAAVAITLGTVPLSVSYSGTRFFVQLPGTDMVSRTRWTLQHIDDIPASDMSLHTLICTAFYNREELKKDVYTPRETLAVKVGNMTAYVDKGSDQGLIDRVAEKLSI